MKKSIDLEFNETKSHKFGSDSGNSITKSDGGRMYFGSAGQFTQQLDSIKGCIQETANRLNVDVQIQDTSTQQVLHRNNQREVTRDRTRIRVVIEKLEDSHKLSEEYLKEKCMGISSERSSVIGTLRNQMGSVLKDHFEKEEANRLQKMTPEERESYKKEKAYKNRMSGPGVRG